MGFVEYVSRQQIRGWVADEQRPDRHIDIVVRVGAAQIASGKAELYRDDLHEAGVGDGDHGFVINLNPMLREADLAALVVSATGVPGGGVVLEKLQASPEAAAPPPAPRAPPIEIGRAVEDAAQFPVFVLGAARSGTSAVAQALLKTGYYAGHEEGHVLALMAQQMKTIQDYYDANGEETLASRDTTLARIPKEYFINAVAESFKALVPNLWKNKHWIDKTPNGQMIAASPLFLQLWPNSRFIFMKRRPLENIVSRMRKFPQLSFEAHCADWASVMTTWTATKYQLGARAIEVEQFELATRPEPTAARLIGFLQLPPAVAALFRQTLLVERPERTSQSFADPLTLQTLDWTDGQRSVFQKICGPLMREHGYTSDGQYYADRTPVMSKINPGSAFRRAQ
jgi:hypothetical protein